MSSSSVRPVDTRSPSPPAGGARAAGKRATRARLLEAAFTLLEDHGFEGLSLRHVARVAGVAPAAIYRHFDDAEALGLALVEASFEALHESIRLARADTERGLSAVGSAQIVLRFTAEHRERFRFLTRERRGGSPALRRAIEAQLELFERDLAVDLMRDPRIRAWATADVQLLAGMLVGLMAEAIAELVTAETPAEQLAVGERARRRLRLLALGIAGWSSASPGVTGEPGPGA
ncbi:TetR family transcriptional regulator [Patulibacter sp.]|uniref:TetR family transcriptional regulator n=1 Tax=Patulibacter sp. TaxID=1912859 RepID=UPI0027168FC7|nr:TetR family transcriptional regulator [Patulibacter sp.]MDO9406889.1 TetR family transcriptional regulator [Patulibacter sp.]